MLLNLRVKLANNRQTFNSSSLSQDPQLKLACLRKAKNEKEKNTVSSICRNLCVSLSKNYEVATDITCQQKLSRKFPTIN